jgi:hypothetical protein
VDFNCGAVEGTGGVCQKGTCDVVHDAIASRLAPTEGCANPVGASLLAMNDDAVFLTESATLALL